jgi:hypothetical protein
MDDKKHLLYNSTQVSGKIAAETGGFRRRFKPPFSLDAKPSQNANSQISSANFAGYGRQDD